MSSLWSSEHLTYLAHKITSKQDIFMTSRTSMIAIRDWDIRWHRQKASHGTKCSYVAAHRSTEDSLIAIPHSPNNASQAWAWPRCANGAISPWLVTLRATELFCSKSRYTNFRGISCLIDRGLCRDAARIMRAHSEWSIGASDCSRRARNDYWQTRGTSFRDIGPKSFLKFLLYTDVNSHQYSGGWAGSIELIISQSTWTCTWAVVMRLLH